MALVDGGMCRPVDRAMEKLIALVSLLCGGAAGYFAALGAVKAEIGDLRTQVALVTQDYSRLKDLPDTVAVLRSEHVALKTRVDAMEIDVELNGAQGVVRISKLLLCFDEYLVSVSDDTPYKETRHELPQNCRFKNDGYKIVATMRSNYGNEVGTVHFAAPVDERSFDLRIARVGVSNRGGTSIVQYVAIGEAP